jgi:hypothetical protein
MADAPLRRNVLCRLLAVAASLLPLWVPAQGAGAPDVDEALYRAQVGLRLELAPADLQLEAALAQQALDKVGATLDLPQYVAVVDRDPHAQAFLLFWRDAAGQWVALGASPVSTGKPGSFDHFQTPVGVFDHNPANPDFRALGTRNANGIRGYGAKGMRVFDFGWQMAPKGWGNREVIRMRLEMHATDPDKLEKRLGTPQSKGCVRIPAALDRLLDHHGILDAAYEAPDKNGRPHWVLDARREPVAHPGRYLVIVDSAGGVQAPRP